MAGKGASRSASRPGQRFVRLAVWLGEEVGALPADRRRLGSSAWGSPGAASCWLQEVPGLWRLLAAARPRASPCHKGAVMRHPPGACELTRPGPVILRSGPAKASWAELAFGTTRLLPLLLARLLFSKHSSFPAHFCPASLLSQR